MDDVATVTEYRLIRPDGTLLWTCTAPSYMIPVPPVSPRQARYPEDYALPPWRYEAREAGAREWTLIGERDFTP